MNRARTDRQYSFNPEPAATARMGRWSYPRLGAMLSRLICKVGIWEKSPRKHAGFAKSACFRGDLALLPTLQTIRESMAPETTMPQSRKNAVFEPQAERNEDQNHVRS